MTLRDTLDDLASEGKIQYDGFINGRFCYSLEPKERQISYHRNPRLGHAQFGCSCGVSSLFAGSDEKIQQLAKSHAAKDHPYDVVTFGEFPTVPVKVKATYHESTDPGYVWELRCSVHGVVDNAHTPLAVEEYNRFDVNGHFRKDHADDIVEWDERPHSHKWACAECGIIQ